MADKMMRVAGRSSDGLAKALLVNENGAPIVTRTWGIDDKTIFNVEIRDTSSHNNITEGTVIDLSEYPINSLRMKNTTDASVTVRLLYDLNTSQITYLIEDGQTIDIVMPSGTSSWRIFTPQNLPVLNYLHYLKMQVTADTAPTTGGVSIIHSGRK